MRRLVLLGVVALVGVGAVALACDDEHRRTPPGKFSGGACQAAPGQLPRPDCDDSTNECTATGCVIDEARCGSTSTCLPLGDNKGKPIVDLRIRRLNIAAPEALAQPLLQNAVVNTGIDLAENTCGEKGNGLFTWLIRVDTQENTLLTGGAPPSNDAIGKGFCFARFDLGGTKIEPISAKIERTGDTLRTAEPLDVNIPIFLTESLSSAIILPITGARVEGVKLTDDGNCIGKFNAAALDNTCEEDRTTCQKWTTAGALGGYITLEQADAVKIATLGNKSLCAFLASEGTSCARDGAGKIVFKGDYCSTDNSPGSCGDSVWLAATFAASAVKIFDGAGSVEGCSGGSAGPADAGSDANDAGDASDAADQ